MSSDQLIDRIVLVLGRIIHVIEADQGPDAE